MCIMYWHFLSLWGFMVFFLLIHQNLSTNFGELKSAYWSQKYIYIISIYYIYISIYLYIYLYIYIYLSIYLSLSIYIYMYIISDDIYQHQHISTYIYINIWWWIHKGSNSWSKITSHKKITLIFEIYSSFVPAYNQTGNAEWNFQCLKKLPS